MAKISVFLRSEQGGMASDALVLILSVGLFFSVVMAMTGAGGPQTTARLGNPTIQIGDGWSFGDTGRRLPQIGPLHTRR